VKLLVIRTIGFANKDSRELWNVNLLLINKHSYLNSFQQGLCASSAQSAKILLSIFGRNSENIWVSADIYLTMERVNKI